ncbi:hypothetical protein [Flavivirga jejuensis]|uniref:YD repeat-containing protein n=1 Tax=Flavivirga jejuensis TaxID=870487 RepID=A0ABT8WS34_9FLAO|nr:hypothetical protein [Flavivirga jejuensis]MDO5976003.1 hypothetical protein [Flavivirga jejuensis]
MNMRLLFLLIFSLAFENGIAQDSYPNVVPPDPVSAQFQKYLGYPVSYATGIPQINIPLYTMNAAGVSIPFSLSYHSSGIKVDEVMGSIGFGWSMFPGFKITRTVMGRPDDEFPTNDIRPLGSYDWQAENAEISALKNDVNFVPDSYFEYLYKITPRKLQDGMFGASTPHSSAPADGQNDIFTIHLPNVNATFILEWIGNELKATTIPESSIKIDVLEIDSYGRFNSFEVTDEDGVLYTFGNSDNLNNNDEHYEYNEDSEAVTSWLLKEINPPGINNKITFNYNAPFNVSYQADLSPTIGFVDEIFGNSIYYDGFDHSVNLNANPPPVTYNSTIYFPQIFSIKSISNITYETGESISFNYSTITNLYDALDNITFKNRDNTTVKTVDFERVNKQLKKLTVSGEGAYEFSYDEQDISDPAGRFIGRDYLGLFNGNFSSISAVPEMYIYFDSYTTNGLTPKKIGHLNPVFDPVKSQARILKNIIYPTGGQTSFEYEPNVYETVTEGVVCGMGLRIKKIDTHDPVSNKTLTKSYKYGQNESGIGNSTLPNIGLGGQSDYANAYITQRTALNETTGMTNTGGSYRYRTISPYAKTNITTEPIIWYDQVTEYSNGGKTIFDYEFTSSEYLVHLDGSTPTNSLDSKSTPIFFPDVFRNIGSAPRLIRQEIKDSNDNTLKLIENNYSDNLRLVRNIFSRVSVWLEGVSGLPESLLNTISILPNSPLYTYVGKYGFLKADNYWLELKDNRLTSTKQTDYRDGEEIVNETTFVYDNTYTFNLKSKTVTTSDGGTLTEKYYYPVGDAIPDRTNLTTDQENMVNTFAASKNYHGRVIEKEVYKNNTLLNKELYGYKDWGNTIYKLENVYTKKGPSGFQSLYTIEDYDDKGNILDVSKEDGTHASYIWGYDKQYPIAKIENADYSDIASALSISPTTLETYDESNMSIINGLRTNASMENSMITTYTYKPLVGITSVTDSKDYTVNYNYNADNKLESIKDDEGKVISDYEYHYIPYGTYDPIPVPAYSGDLNCGGGQTLLGDNAPYGTYSITPSSHDFLLSDVGSTNTMTFVIENTTPAVYLGSTLTISAINLPNGFEFANTSSTPPFTVTRGTPKNIQISFKPTAVTTYSGIADISGASGPNLQLSGEGRAASNTGTRIIDIRYNGASINSLDFGTIYNNGTTEEESAFRTIEVYNTGTSTLTLSNANNNNSLIFISNYGFPYTIAPGAYISFEIEFILSNNNSYPESQSAVFSFISDKTGGNNGLLFSGIIDEY